MNELYGCEKNNEYLSLIEDGMYTILAQDLDLRHYFHCPLFLDLSPHDTP